MEARIISTPVFEDYGYRTKQLLHIFETYNWNVWPWHIDLFKLLTAFDVETGNPIHDEAIIILPRQVGKSAATFTLALDHLVREDRQKGALGIYSSHGTTNALSILKSKMFPNIEDIKLPGADFKINRSTTSPGIENLANTRFLNVLSASSTSGRGESPALVILDEALELKNYERVNSLAGGQTNIDNSQFIYLSTAPKSYSYVLHKEMEDALQRIKDYEETGDRSFLDGPAIFMTQVEEEIDVWNDDLALFQANPSIGCKGGPSIKKLIKIRNARRSTNPEGFKNEYLNIPEPLVEDEYVEAFNQELLEKSYVTEHENYEPHAASMVPNENKTTWYVSSSDGKRIKFEGEFESKEKAIRYLQGKKIYQVAVYGFDFNVYGFVKIEIKNKEYQKSSGLFEKRLVQEKLQICFDKKLLEDIEHTKKVFDSKRDSFGYKPIDREISGIFVLKSMLFALYCADERPKFDLEKMYSF